MSRRGDAEGGDDLVCGRGLEQESAGAGDTPAASPAQPYGRDRAGELPGLSGGIVRLKIRRILGGLCLVGAVVTPGWARRCAVSRSAKRECQSARRASPRARHPGGRW